MQDFARQGFRVRPQHRVCFVQDKQGAVMSA